MGDILSTFAPSTGPSLTDQPWRQPSYWDTELEHTLKEDIQKANPTEKPNILMIGPVGSGKSSFINSVLSIGKNRKCETAPSGGVTMGESYTLKLETYNQRTDLLKNYRLVDCTGLEEKTTLNPDDIFAVLTGHIKRGYTFNPKSSIQVNDRFYRSDPSRADQTQCVVFVVDARMIQFDILSDYLERIRVLQHKIRKEGIPRVLILTKVDLMCDEVKKDITKLFWSVKIQEVVKIAGEVFGIAPASIHPVINYETDYNINPEANIPLLLALRQAVQYAEDWMEHLIQQDLHE